MGKNSINASSAQGAGDASPKTVDHVVNQDDLDNNPELGAAGVKLGDTIQVPAESDVESEAPEWVEKVLASNHAVIESNNSVINSIQVFKETASDVAAEIVQLAKSDGANLGSRPTPKTENVDFDPDAVYIVAQGKSFQDRESHVMFTEGMNVTRLGELRLRNLISQGLVEEEY